MTMKQDNEEGKTEDPEAAIARQLERALDWERAEEVDAVFTRSEAAELLENALRSVEITLTRRYLEQCPVLADANISAHVDAALVLIREAQRLLDGVPR